MEFLCQPWGYEPQLFVLIGGSHVKKPDLYEYYLKRKKCLPVVTFQNEPVNVQL